VENVTPEILMDHKISIAGKCANWNTTAQYDTLSAYWKCRYIFRIYFK